MVSSLVACGFLAELVLVSLSLVHSNLLRKIYDLLSLASNGVGDFDYHFGECLDGESSKQIVKQSIQDKNKELIFMVDEL